MLARMHNLSNIIAGELINAENFQIECIGLSDVKRSKEKLSKIENFFTENIHAKFSVHNNNVFFQSTHVIVLWLFRKNIQTVVGCIHFTQTPSVTTEANIYQITSICASKNNVPECTYFWHNCEKQHFFIVCHMLQYLKQQAAREQVLWIEIALKSSSKLVKMLQKKNFFIAGVRGKQKLQKTYHLLCMDWEMQDYALTLY